MCTKLSRLICGVEFKLSAKQKPNDDLELDNGGFRQGQHQEECSKRQHVSIVLLSGVSG